MKNIVLFLMILSVMFAATAELPAASNAVQDGNVLSLTWSTSSPNAGDPVVKSNASATGGIVGVALTGESDEGEVVSVSTRGVYKIPVQALTSAITIGQTLYTSVTDLQTGVASVTNTTTGLKFGKALEALAVASGTQTIKVLIVQP